MRINKVEAITHPDFPNLIHVKVSTDSGVYGVGESYYFGKSVAAFITEFAGPAILGMDPSEIEKISRAGAIAVVLGGDHSIASADVAGIAEHRGKGKISMVHFDAHADTGDLQFGALVGHGTPMRRLIENGYVRGDRFLQLGLRGYWPDDATLNWMRDQGMRSYEMTTS